MQEFGLNGFKTSEEEEIITKIRDLITSKKLKPGDRLPSERKLSEEFGVSRGNVREVIQKLEFYGLLKTLPQSGTFVANLGVPALSGMITDILQLKKPDFKSLVESRIMLEMQVVALAAERRTERHLEQIGAALEAYRVKVENNEDAVEEDLMFHLKISEASGNPVLNTLMLIITPEIIANFEKYHVCTKSMTGDNIVEHQQIYDAIKEKNPEKAKRELQFHFKTLYEYCNKTDTLMNINENIF
ncbi:FadR/GntR family transcriptional regulator [Flavobacterium kingsejongi]|uniref:GntR family transcriptional regulator n=1 Tax=Flavobacterium kingsejongi TaxID=1678728 RepID=A0A2S1LMW2_9FLAO|nr:FadR/GntR family transcriptional regulator [Flavobacterium kingsejongi]AWG25018.1 GntR family transcriptional regulator [Flavobacterium kingsejongi]